MEPLSVEQLLQIEALCHPEAGKWRYRDIELWPLIRNQLGAAGYWNRVNVPRKGLFRRIVSGLEIRLRLLRNHFRYRQAIQKHGHRVAIFANQRYPLNGKWCLGLLHPVYEEAVKQGCNPLVLERDIYTYIEKTPHAECSSTVLLLPFQWDYWKILFGGRPTPAQANVTPSEVVQALSAAFRKLNIETGPRELAVLTGRAWSNAAYADREGYRIGKVLKYAGVETAFYICAYGSLGFAAAIACRRNRIRSVEIQHGCEYNQYAYVNWSEIPSAGYQVYPDIFWCWSSVEAGQIQEWAQRTNRHRAVCGGHPWLEYYHDSVKEECERDLLDFISKNRISSPKKAVILVTLQTTREDFPDFFEQYVEDHSDDYLWIVRGHPGNYQKPGYYALDFYKELAGRNKNVNWELGTLLPLPLLLKHVDVNITPYSATAMEAALCRVFNIFTSPLAGNLFEFIISRGLGATAADADSIDRLLREQADAPRNQSGGGSHAKDVMHDIFNGKYPEAKA